MLRLVCLMITQQQQQPIMMTTAKVPRTQACVVQAPGRHREAGLPRAQMESEHVPSPCTFCRTNVYNLIMTFNVWNGGFYILLRRHCWLLCVILPVYIAMQIIPGGEFTNCTSIINRVMIFPIPLLSLLPVSYIIHAHYPSLVSVPGRSGLSPSDDSNWFAVKVKWPCPLL